MRGQCTDTDTSCAKYDTCRRRIEAGVGYFNREIITGGILNFPDYIPKSNGGKNNG